MQLEIDFNQSVQASGAKPEPMASIEPERRGELKVFPLRRHALVQRIAASMRSIRDDDEREKYMDTTMLSFFRSRRLDGLSFTQARADLKTFEAAIRAEYRRPTPPPLRWRDHDSLVNFPEKKHDRQTA